MDITQEQMDRVKEVAQHLCRKNGITGYDQIQDVEGECLLAAVTAAAGVDEFTDGLLVQAAKWAFFNGARASVRQPEMVSMDEEFEGEDGEIMTMHDLIESETPGPESIMEAEETADLFQEFLDGLTEQESDILTMLFGLEGEAPMTLRECAEVCGMSHVSVSKIRDRAFAKLRGRGIADALGLDV